MTLSIALIEPQIPPNTGSIARLAGATDSALHVIGPTGFDLDHPETRRAGLDYWEHVDLWSHPDWFAFRDAVSRERCLYFSSHGAQSYLDADYRSNSVLVFGNETAGMPQRILEKHAERTFRIPMREHIRSLNLATAVAIVLYEAIRRVNPTLDPFLTGWSPDVPVPQGRADQRRPTWEEGG